MNTSSSTFLLWSERFPLKDAFLRQESGGGLYVWGFDGHRGEVIWYLGKATSRKGVYRRLRKHYLDIMSGQYQIPKGFLNGRFQSPECSTSGWQIKFGDPKQAMALADWNQMQGIFRAGHAFAHSAFARVAILNTEDSTLKALERLAIQQLEPVVNNHRPPPSSGHSMEMTENGADRGWLTRWRDMRSTSMRSDFGFGGFPSAAVQETLANDYADATAKPQAR